MTPYALAGRDACFVLQATQAKSLCCRSHNASHAWNARTRSQLLPDLPDTRRRPIAPSIFSVRWYPSNLQFRLALELISEVSYGRAVGYEQGLVLRRSYLDGTREGGRAVLPAARQTDQRFTG